MKYVCVNILLQTSKENVNYFAYVFLRGVSPKLPCENVDDFLPDPSSLGERGEGEIIRVYLPQPCNTENTGL